MKIKPRIVESLAEQVDAIQGRIARRAHELWMTRDASLGCALDDWLHAERETVWRPPVEVRRENGAFLVEAALAGVEPSQLDVQASSDELVLAAPLHHDHATPAGEILTCEFARGPLFRSVRFPEPVDPRRVKAEIRNGLLRVTAPVAGRTKVEVTAS
jgi:HSP20 family protein